MSVTSTGNNYINSIAATNSQTDNTTQKDEDVLGRDSFLTMLVAQLENQDPLNPMEGSDFSAQLAQFSQLEQLMNISETMEGMKTALEKNSEGNAFDYIGKTVTGKMDTMDVKGGVVSGGSYTIDRAADVMISITNSQGNTVRTLYPGQQNSGVYGVNWDGKDSGGNYVADGTYNYKIMANTGSGFVEVPSTITGKVEGVVYEDDKPYLIVDGASLGLESIVAVLDNSQQQETEPSIADYLGRNITTSAPSILVEGGAVLGDELSFDLNTAQDAVVQVYDQNNQLVRSIILNAESAKTGTNSVTWNGLNNSGDPVDNGIYYYTVETADSVVRPPATGQVTAIKYIEGVQYLVMQGSGRIATPAAVTGIN